MYQQHWGMRESPFCSGLDPRSFYASPTHDEALARLQFLVDHHRRLGLLLGGAGSGKSLVLAVFAQQMAAAGRPAARVQLQGLEPAELLCQLGWSLGLSTRPADQPALLWTRLADRLAEFRYQQWPTAILLDDADLATPMCLAWALRLARFDPSPDSRLTVVLAGQRPRLADIGTQLLELVELRIDLDPWEAAETADYLSHALARVGRQAPLFTPAAIARLHELTEGVPRRVAQLADLALLAGAGQKLEQIDAEVLEGVFYELGMVEV